MATKKSYDLAVITGTYKDSSGAEKHRYQNVGAILKNDNGPYIILEPWFNPAGIQHEPGKGVIVSMFKPKEPSQPRRDNDDDIPFGP